MLTDYGVSHAAKVMTGQESTPASLFLALCLSTPLSTATGSDLNEPSVLTAPDYFRQEIPMDQYNWTVPWPGEDTSSYVYEIWYNPSYDWGLITSFALCDSSVMGNVIHYDDLQVPMLMAQYSSIQVPSFALTIRVS